MAKKITWGLLLIDTVLDETIGSFAGPRKKASADDLPVAIRDREVRPDLAHPLPSLGNRPEGEVGEAQPLWPDSAVDHSDDHIFSEIALSQQPPVCSRQSQKLRAVGGSSLEGPGKVQALHARHLFHELGLLRRQPGRKPV